MHENIFDNLKNIFEIHSNFFTGKKVNLDKFSKVVKVACQKYLYCLSNKNIKHFPNSILEHADEYTSFLVFLANTAYDYECLEIAKAAYLINRRMNSFDCFYDRKIPEIFHLEHPIGSIIGKASLKNYLVIYQGVTIGGDLKLKYPILEESVALFPNSSVISNAKLGYNSAVGTGVTLYGRTLKNNTAISLRNNQETITKMTWQIKERFFKI